MEKVILGFCIGMMFTSVLVLIDRYYFYKNLTITAETHQNEKILGKWYKITPME